jgi:uncharacterized membrane protein
MKEFAGIIEVFVWAVFFIGWILGIATTFFYRKAKSLFTE